MHPRLELLPLPWAGLAPQGATGTLLRRENTTEHNSQSGDSTTLVEGPPSQEWQQGGLWFGAVSCLGALWRRLWRRRSRDGFEAVSGDRSLGPCCKLSTLPSPGKHLPHQGGKLQGMTCCSFPNKPEPGLLDKELLRLSSAVGKAGASSQNPAQSQLGRSGRFGKRCTQVLNERESECARSLHIPEDLELLQAPPDWRV